MQAIAKAADNDVVYLPAGTYRIDKSIALGGKSDITIRGAGPDKTVIMAHHTVLSALNLGDHGGADWLWASPNAAIAGSPVEGATVLTVGDTKLLAQPMRRHRRSCAKSR